MPIELRVPSLGESITQATIGAWLKKEGDAVAADEPVVEVESEKATVAVPAPSAGVISRVLKESGATVEIGEVIAVLEEGAAAKAAGPSPSPAPATPTASTAQQSEAAPEAAPSRAAAPAPPAAPPAPKSDAVREAPPIRAATPAPRSPAEAAAAPGAGADRVPLRAPPSVRRHIAETGVDPRAVALRSGPQPVPSAPPAPLELREDERAVPMTPLRRTVARRLLEAQQNAAILTTFNEVDMAKVIALREKHGATFLERHGVKLGFMSFFVKAAVEALRAFPVVNAEIRGDSIVYKDHHDIGVAVGGGKGLVVPVLRDADRMSFADIEKSLADLAKKARENRITMADLQGGTFTISNGGIYGSLLSTPILNPPQSGILGLHKIEKRPKVGADDAVVVRPMMYLALSYDHRLVDGREAVSFLVRLKDCIEDPERLLLEI
ncbi:MAG TPA: 2-oxoglutarate dehydrogenase complex dihydrolipoyllysine-residue succinyltransferase [Anaeromyxobacteraceae bacterium]|nr:2-oxoglutarate dehydrogenase complex dihydrolipoyllysine-residue succinyltransferase [Anaeromyxobacteraceae bacterium]